MPQRTGLDQVTFDRSKLHRSLGEPSLGAIGFLNEVMSRYPDAISFAPGAPNLAFLDGFDEHRYIERFVEHLAHDRGLGTVRARRLLCEYGPSAGVINDLVADALRAEQGIDVAADGIVITVGAQEAMLLVLRALFRDPGDTLVVQNPCFAGIVGAAKLLDISVVPVRDTGNGLDLDRLARMCRAQRGAVRAVYVSPDHANPSGTVLDLTARQELLDLAAREDFVVIEDNAYAFTAAPGVRLPSLKAMAPQRVVLIGTFAKVCLPGARVGFAVAEQTVRAPDGSSRPLAKELAALKTMTTVNTSPICQAIVGGMLLEHGGGLAALGETRATLYRRNLLLLLDCLDDALGDEPHLTWNRPSGGFFVRMALPCRADHALLERSAAEFGVLWTPMSAFSLDDSGDHQLRLSCSYLDREQVAEGVGRLAALLRRSHPCPP